MHSSGFLRRPIAASVLMLATTTALTSFVPTRARAETAQAQPKYSFNIPAGSLSSALVSFSAQSRIQVTSSGNANCQTMVSVILASGEVPLMLSLRLFLPESWTGDVARMDNTNGYSL